MHNKFVWMLRLEMIGGEVATRRFYIAGFSMREIAETLAWEEECVEKSCADTSGDLLRSRRGSEARGQRNKSYKTVANRRPEIRSVLERTKGIGPSYAAWEARSEDAIVAPPSSERAPFGSAKLYRCQPAISPGS